MSAGGGGGGRRARLLRVGRAYVADTATVTARVTLGEDANIWYGVVIRGDDAPITLGARTNVQDGSVVHVDPGAPHVIGHDVTIGHGALCHGVRIEDHVLVGMGAVLLGGSVIGEGSIVGAGALVLEDVEIPPFSLVVGSPARVVRSLEPDERRAQAVAHAGQYVEQARAHAAGDWDGMVHA
jgi:carbonic anhydrase/acetyltransferase-like protein (isoleucine patch superfamily)